VDERHRVEAEACPCDCPIVERAPLHQAELAFQPLLAVRLADVPLMMHAEARRCASSLQGCPLRSTPRGAVQPTGRTAPATDSLTASGHAAQETSSQPLRSRMKMLTGDQGSRPPRAGCRVPTGQLAARSL
jgi:hypothetical protein